MQQSQAKEVVNDVVSVQIADSGVVAAKVEEDEKEKAGDVDGVEDIISSMQHVSAVSAEPEEHVQQQQQQLLNVKGDDTGNVQSKSFSSFSSIDINSTSQANLNNANANGNGNDNAVVNVESSSDVKHVSDTHADMQGGDEERGSDNDDDAAGGDMVDLLNVQTDEMGQTQPEQVDASNATDDVANQ
mmetsp:Transcript_2445/g.3960  ORF Transcript_2445/g.3960 Transcript_2445/m.3960 type:complete len:187 (+) Transcript_2445:2-562(+)